MVRPALGHGCVVLTGRESRVTLRMVQGSEAGAPAPVVEHDREVDDVHADGSIKKDAETNEKPKLKEALAGMREDQPEAEEAAV